MINYIHTYVHAYIHTFFIVSSPKGLFSNNHYLQVLHLTNYNTRHSTNYNPELITNYNTFYYKIILKLVP